jgi:4-amino-4-deoxy-L-arabinose transferase-like glycosyltransferase
VVISTPNSGTEWFSKIRCLTARHPYWTLTVIVLAALGPFLAKPFNIDDPLFIWAAHQIQAHPADPYGFNVEWGWREFPMWKVTENPPLACYYLAAAAGILGWSELALHTAFLLPLLAAVFGTYRLARHFCSQPMLAALATLFTPVVFVSSLTVTCDVMMLAFWVWAVVFWVEGTEQEKLWKLFAAAGLIALAELTKYYGVCLIPLVAAFSLMRRRPVRRWGQFLLLPLAILLAYQLATQALYGTSLLFRAMDYAAFSKVFLGYSQAQTCLTALAFTGGCVAVAAIFAPLLWRFRMLAVFSGGGALATVIFFLGGTIWQKYGPVQGAARLSVEIQFFIWTAAGFSALALAAADVRQRREARSCLLALWVLGTFSFAAFVNWTVNARSVLPLVPAVGILIARQLERSILLEQNIWKRGAALCLIISAALALLVTRADYMMAVAVRQNARAVCATYKSDAATLWFQGHWGFQFYMQADGGHPLDLKSSPLNPGDNLVLPVNNTVLQPDLNRMILRGNLSVAGPHWLTTWNMATGAGFYATVWGPLPFAFGRVPPESVSVYILKPLLQAAPPNSK